MKIIKITKIKNQLKKLINDASFNLPCDILNAILEAHVHEKNKNAKKILSLIVENSKTSPVCRVPLCQDCGTVYIEILIGKNTCVENFSEIEDEINSTVEEAYKESYLRKSIVNDPLFERKNTGTNTPAIISFGSSDFEGIELNLSLKGGGSDNCSYLFMLNPSTTPEELTAIVKDLVVKNATKSCPPLIIGIGIGGSASKVMELARKAAFRNLDVRNFDTRYDILEKNILKEINSTDIGPAGLGGDITALAVNIEFAPCHIAEMPFAVSFLCHSARRACAKISFPERS
ncbi:MAG: fumarate hydratase [Actinobacteria bacterium]|nr:fumarate hydratase [Actinomycetota bacterium]